MIDLKELTPEWAEHKVKTEANVTEPLTTDDPEAEQAALKDMRLVLGRKIVNDLDDAFHDLVRAVVYHWECQRYYQDTSKADEAERQLHKRLAQYYPALKASVTVLKEIGEWNESMQKTFDGLLHHDHLLHMALSRWSYWLNRNQRQRPIDEYLKDYEDEGHGAAERVVKLLAKVGS